MIQALRNFAEGQPTDEDLKMETIEFHQEAVAKAEANLQAHQTSYDEHMAAEHAMANGNDALLKRKVQIGELLKTYEAELEAAVDSGGKHPQNNTAELRAEMVAIDSVTAKFPAKLAAHRGTSSLISEAHRRAQDNFRKAQFDLAVFQYQKAMEPVWEAADNARAAAAAYSAHIDLTGLADSRSKYGKLPAA